jgi:hypothetical protein
MPDHDLVGRPLRLSGWIPLAQVQDGDSPLPKHQCLYPLQMRALVHNFNNSKYRPPVIFGTTLGSRAQLKNPLEPGGYIADLDFDGIHVWGRFAEIVDPDGTPRIEDAVRSGHLGRSIGYWATNAGAKGFMFRHLALLAGEPKGQRDLDLPSLTSYFGETLGVEGARAAAKPFVCTKVLWPPTPERQQDIVNLRRPAGRSTCIYAPPGWRLRRFAEALFAPKTYKQVFEPTLRDLEDEYCQALLEKRSRKAKWVCLRGYWSFWEAVVAQSPISLFRVMCKLWKASL